MLLGSLQSTLWGYFFRCNRCDFSQHLPNPQLVIRYEHKHGLRLWRTTTVYYQDHYGWCKECDGVVLCEHPNILRSTKELASDERSLKKQLNLRKQGEDGYDSLVDAFEQARDWRRFTTHAKRKRRKLSCFRCGGNIYESVHPTHPFDLPDEDVVVIPLIKHFGCITSGDLVQLNYDAIKLDKRFAKNVVTLEYEFPGVRHDAHGIRSILVDSEGRFMGTDPGS